MSTTHSWGFSHTFPPTNTSPGLLPLPHTFPPISRHSMTHILAPPPQVLLSRPLLVVGPSPADCSGAVAALVSLCAPLPYAPDFR